MGPRGGNGLVERAGGAGAGRHPGADPGDPAAYQRRADRVAALVSAGEYERAIGAAVGIDRARLAGGARTAFLLDVAQAQFGLGWYGDALWTISRAQRSDRRHVGDDIAVRLMVHAIAVQHAEVIDARLLEVVVLHLRPEPVTADGTACNGGFGGP